ncbi:MAG: hypothetical protein AYK19_01325 [Theionarchaea archaeon DG-70-1]|nr:MAG: hypothetical protein AYK19_01325 [Theionarchaea archaeon DG-70-1]
MERYIMILVYSILQESATSVIEDIVNLLISLFSTYQLYILIAIGLIILYFVVTRLIFRGTIYKSARKEPMVTLSMSGRERSLEYLERFGEMKGVDAQVIRYLRKHGSLPKKQLEKTFGSKVIRRLIEKGMIRVV